MADAFEEVQLQGHIIDSLLLPKVLDTILTRGGTYVIKDIDIGQRGTDPSLARIEVRADSPQRLQEILGADPRPRCDSGPCCRCHYNCRRLGRSISRGFLLHDEFPHASAAWRRMDRRSRAGDGLRNCRRCGGEDCSLRSDGRRASWRPCRRRSCGRARSSRRLPSAAPTCSSSWRRRCRAKSPRERPSGRSPPPCSAASKPARRSWPCSARRWCTPAAANGLAS